MDNSTLTQAFVEAVLAPLFFPLLSNQRIYWLYLLTALIMAIAVYCLTGSRRSNGRLLSWLFPAAIYRHASTGLDLRFFLVNRMLLAFVILPFLASASFISEAFADTLSVVTAAEGIFSEQPKWAAGLLITLLALLATDFALFLTHYLQHRIATLWEFHKVHHSAQVLTPLTVYRMHPVDDLLTLTAVALFTGIINGAWLYLSGGTTSAFLVHGGNFFLFVFFLLGYNLRHSHIWLSFGPLHAILISPAQHQIHHSSAARHVDKNFGFMLSIWDRLFGTLYVPEGRETLRWGLRHEEHREYDSLARLYLLPFRKASKTLGSWKAVAAAGLILLLISGSALLWRPTTALAASQLNAPPPSLRLELLTWEEVAHAVESGFRTVIVPTAGLEQNGPHMILGKHTQIVSHNADAIAEALGHTLVAPVVNYTPEGRISPPSGHMRFAGTISIPEEIYAGILRATAESLKTHGFNLICFLGDSGDSQTTQQKVADELNHHWPDGARVLQVSDYYFENQQTEWLKDSGYSDRQIGRHAGIRDTSELMAIAPHGLRDDRRRRGRPGSGSDGNPKLATVEIGHQMLKLKINAATRQIGKARAALD